MYYRTVPLSCSMYLAAVSSCARKGWISKGLKTPRLTVSLTTVLLVSVPRLPTYSIQNGTLQVLTNVPHVDQDPGRSYLNVSVYSPKFRMIWGTMVRYCILTYCLRYIIVVS